MKHSFVRFILISNAHHAPLSLPTKRLNIVCSDGSYLLEPELVLGCNAEEGSRRTGLCKSYNLNSALIVETKQIPRMICDDDFLHNVCDRGIRVDIISKQQYDARSLPCNTAEAGWMK